MSISEKDREALENRLKWYIDAKLDKVVFEPYKKDWDFIKKAFLAAIVMALIWLIIKTNIWS